MKYIIVFLLLLSANLLHAASPVISVTPGVTNSDADGLRVAPLCNFFDATGTTDADETQPFRTLLHKATFGNTAAGNWAYGSSVGSPKNFHAGAPLTAHCYAAAGSYTWGWTATDSSGNSASTGATITVTDPDTVFSTNTACVYNSTLGTGCSGTEIASSDLDAALATAQGANGCGTGIPCKRIRFKAGDTFTASVTAALNTQGPGIIESYGTANSGRAIFTAEDNSTSLTILSIASTTINVSNWRIKDIEITMSGKTNTWHKSAVCVGCEGTNDAVRFITFYNVYIHDIGDGIKAWTGSGDGYPSTNIIVANSVIQDIASSNTDGSDDDTLSGGKGVTLYSANSAIIGTLIDNTVKGEHNIRVQNFNKLVIAHNTLIDANNLSTPYRGSKENISLRADVDAAATSRYAAVSDNNIQILGYAGVSTTMNDPTTQDADISDVLLERNLTSTTNSAGIKTVQLTGSYRNTIRNNIFNMSGAGADGTIVRAEKYAAARAVNDTLIANNTVYDSVLTTQNVTYISLDAATTVVTAINNLVYNPNRASGTQDLLAGMAATETTNSTAPFTTNPQFASATPSNPIDFAIGSANAAASGGTALFHATKSDFFHCFDKTAATNRIGAIVPRANAICVGAP